MKYIISSILLIICCLPNKGFAQQPIKFEDLQEQEAGMSNFDKMMLYRKTLALQPHSSALNYRSAVVYYNILKECHPILDYTYGKRMYGQIKIHSDFASAYLDEKNAKRDREFYGEVNIISGNKKAEFEDIKQHVLEERKEIDQYFTNLETLYQSYTTCVSTYGTCLVEFRDIVETYSNEKALYLQANEQMRQRIDSLGSRFNLCVQQFETFQKSCEFFPQFLSVPQYKLMPIETYRLEGLVEARFYEPEVKLWDFTAWASSFKKVITDDIDAMHNQLVTSNEAINNEITMFETHNTFSDTYLPYRTSERLLNQVGHYDYASLSLELFDYKHQKLEFLNRLHQESCNPNDTLDISIAQRLRYYESLKNELIDLNKASVQLHAHISPEGFDKFKRFFSSQYKTLAGLGLWCQNEVSSNNKSFNKGIDHLFQSFQNEEDALKYNESTCVKGKMGEIPFGIQSIDVEAEKVKETYTTLVRLPFMRNNWILAGDYVSKWGTVTPFITMVRADSIKSWENRIVHKKLGDKQVSRFVAAKALSHDVYFGIDDSYLANGAEARQTTIVNYQFNGKESKRITFKNEGRFIDFYVDDISGELITIHQNEAFHIRKLSSKGEIVWEKTLEIVGEYVDIIPTNGNFFLTMNTNADHGANITGTYLSAEGEVLSTQVYELDQPIRLQYAQKVNSDCFNLLGKYGENENLYLLTNAEGKLEFSNKQIETPHIVDNF